MVLEHAAHHMRHPHTMCITPLSLPAVLAAHVLQTAI